jgi:Tfp pilus assembly protein FimT
MEGTRTDPDRKKRMRGFSMIEALIVIAVTLIVATMAVTELQPLVQEQRANAGLDQTVGQLRTARELAISSRRDIEVAFIGNNQIQLTREEVPAGTTVLSTLTLEGTVGFLIFPGVPDTPDAFGNAFAVDFANLNGGPPLMKFQSDGTFVDGNGNPINGTVFLGVTNIQTSARAVTVFGGTGKVRPYKATPNGWIK